MIKGALKINFNQALNKNVLFQRAEILGKLIKGT